MRTRVIAAAGSLVLALGVAPALAGNGEGGENRNPRAQGAPGWACKQEGKQPGTQEYRECVRAKAQARRQAIAAANREARAALAEAIATCRQENPPGPARRACVKAAKQAAKTARQQRRQALKAAIAQCRQAHDRGTPELRTCVKAAKAAAKVAQL